MPVWNVSLADLENQLSPEDRPKCFDEKNPRYCLNMVQASARWAYYTHRNTGYPTFCVENGHALVMGGRWTLEAGGDWKTTFQDLAVNDLTRQGLDPNDFTEVGVLKWARATNKMADEGKLDNGTCAFITGEYTPTVRGSQALYIDGRATAKQFYQARFVDIPQTLLEAHDPDFKRLGGRFDVWTRAIYKAVIPFEKDPTEADWIFPNYQVSAEGKHGAYVVNKVTRQGHYG